MFQVNAQLLIQALGITFMGLGAAARLGLWKKWYWRTKGTVYTYLPLGLLFILYSFDEPVKERLGSNYWLYLVCYGVLIALGLWMSFRPPAFVKPAWVRWIEEYPKNIYQAMEQAAKEDENWDRHVVSQQALDAWVATLKIKKPKSKTGSKRAR